MHIVLRLAVAVVAVGASRPLGAQEVLWTWTPPTGEIWFPQPLAADFDGDGQRDIVLVGPSTVQVLSGADSSLLLDLDTGALKTGLVDVYDYDGSGVPDLVFNEPIGGGDYALTVRSGSDGSVLRTFPTDSDGSASGVLVSDISGDGEPDMVILRVQSYSRVQARASEDGRWLWGNDTSSSGSVRRVGDVDGSGYDDVVAGGDNGFAVIDSKKGHDVGVLAIGWRHPLVQDLDGDGFGDVYDCTGPNNDPYHVILSSRDGSELLRVPAPDCQNSNESRPLGDLNGDGHHEILYSADHRFVVLSGHDLETELYCMDDDKTLVHRIERGIVAGGDFDADGFDDFFRLAGDYATLERVDLLSGSALWLSSNHRFAEEGDSLRLQAGIGAAGKLSLLAVTAIDGVPFWYVLVRGPYDDDGLLALEATVPPGLAGTALEFLGIGLDAQNQLQVTFPYTVQFE